MLPKANERILVSFDNGAHTVKYYNKDMHKILASQNCRIIDANQSLPLEDHTIDPLETNTEDQSDAGNNTAQIPSMSADVIP